MSSDRERWDARHAEQSGQAPRTADPFVRGVLAELGPGANRRALDLASGTGRHALLMAQLGWRVEAWDVSPVALGIVRERAEAQHLSVGTRVADLTELPRGTPAASLVVVVDLLDRDLLARLPELLAPGGAALLSTFTEDWPGSHPSPRFRLKKSELTLLLPGLERVRCVESGGRVGLWARAPGRLVTGAA